MENHLEKILQEQYKMLPQNLKESLKSPELSEKVIEIGGKFKISEEKIGELAMISAAVLIGILPLSDLPKELKETLTINKDVSQDLAKSLESEVFSKYKNDIKEIYKGQETLQVKPSTEKPVERIDIKEELLKKKGPDKYRESFEKGGGEQAKTVKEEGKIKKVF
jgi:hypothetical protein